MRSHHRSALVPRQQAQSPDQIANWAERKSHAAHTPKYKRLTDDQRVAILKLHQLGKPQTEIAQAVGCDQGTVSRWLSQCLDTTEAASTYLRGSALRMARNVVQRGTARDHNVALAGLNVLHQQDRANLQIVINGLTLSGTGHDEKTFASVEGEVIQDLHRLSDDNSAE